MPTKRTLKDNTPIDGVIPNNNKEFPYSATILVNRNIIRLGNFKTEDEAINAYKRALLRYKPILKPKE